MEKERKEDGKGGAPCTGKSVPTEEEETEEYHKWSLTICDGCFDTLNSSKMRS